MTERQEPTISPYPLDRGEGNESRGGRTRPPNTGPASPRPITAPASTRTVTVRSPLGPWALVLALAALGLSGFLYWQLMEAQTLLRESASTLTATEQRVQELENKLSLADDESTQSMATLQARIKDNSSEIRKLWGVSYDTNRSMIEKLQGSTAQLSKSVDGLESSLEQQTEELSGEVDVLSELVEAQQSAISRVDRTLDSQSQKIDEYLAKLETLEKDLRQRMASNEEAIRAMDAFRLQVNRELLQLKGG